MFFGRYLSWVECDKTVGLIYYELFVFHIVSSISKVKNQKLEKIKTIYENPSKIKGMAQNNFSVFVPIYSYSSGYVFVYQFKLFPPDPLGRDFS